MAQEKTLDDIYNLLEKGLGLNGNAYLDWYDSDLQLNNSYNDDILWELNQLENYNSEITVSLDDLNNNVSDIKIRLDDLLKAYEDSSDKVAVVDPETGEISFEDKYIVKMDDIYKSQDELLTVIKEDFYPTFKDWVTTDGKYVSYILFVVLFAFIFKSIKNFTSYIRS